MASIEVPVVVHMDAEEVLRRLKEMGWGPEKTWALGARRGPGIPLALQRVRVCGGCGAPVPSVLPELRGKDGRKRRPGGDDG